MNARVLIVDDSLTVRMDLSEAFDSAGFSTTACATAGEARAALSNEDNFDLIILDVLLPDDDGVELLREIRETPQTAATAIILLSSLAQVSARIRGLRTGADEYIGKPYEIRNLISCARQLLRLRRAESVWATILVIDDSATFREHLRQLLQSAGYDVVVAVSGENGLHVAADVRPNAIIVDGSLPGIDGFSVVSRLRMDVALRHTPCLVLTASDDTASEVKALESGADCFIRKSEDSAVLLARLAATLRNGGGTSLATATPSLTGPKKILAVDDDELFLKKTMADFKREGYEVVPATSGKEALEFLASEPVDCVLLDLIMPGMGGAETCRRIKASWATRIPVIMLTVLDENEAMITALSAGADDFLPKSSNFAVLRARLLAQIRRKNFGDESRMLLGQITQSKF